VPELVRDYRAIRQDLLARGRALPHRHGLLLGQLCVASQHLGAHALRRSSLRVALAAHMLSAAGMALFWQQLAFVGHDLDPDIQHLRQACLRSSAAASGAPTTCAGSRRTRWRAPWSRTSAGSSTKDRQRRLLHFTYQCRSCPSLTMLISLFPPVEIKSASCYSIVPHELR
jgi:hypothetical protein